jgi:hypothetical protein
VGVEEIEKKGVMGREEMGRDVEGRKRGEWM